MVFKRIVAGIVDLILLISVAFAPTFIAAEWLPQYMDAPAGQPPTPLMGVTLLWLASVLFCYFPAFESSAFMATPGKLLMRLKVVRRTGERLTLRKRSIAWSSARSQYGFCPGTATISRVVLL